MRLGLVKEDQVLKALGEQLGMKVIKLADMTIPAELTELVNESDGDGLQGRADLAEQEGQERHRGDGRAAEPVDARQPAARSWASRSRGRSPPRAT